MVLIMRIETQNLYEEGAFVGIGRAQCGWTSNISDTPVHGVIMRASETGDAGEGGGQCLTRSKAFRRLTQHDYAICTVS